MFLLPRALLRLSLLAMVSMSAASSASDVDTLFSRLYAQFQGSGDNATTINGWLSSLKTDGTWPDVNYAARDRTNWPPMTHLNRMLSMARAYRNAAHPLYNSGAVRDGFLSALDGWVRVNPQSDNWWYVSIGPQLALGPATILMRDQLSETRIASGCAILARSWTIRSAMTGDNLVWVSTITVWRGCILDSAALVTEAVQAIVNEIRISPAEGIQQDWSFHQHGPQLYAGGYGLGFSSDGAEMADLCRGTQFAFPSVSLDILAHYILDGQQWMMRGTTIDHSVQGREITRPNSANKKSSFVQICKNMQAATTARSAEFTAFQDRLNAWLASSSIPVTGNLHFWRSDYMIHQRPGFFASVRMCSKRTRGAEVINSEGLMSYYLGDGVTYLYRSGNEYLNIFPIWDWTRLPGVTCQHDTAPPPMPTSAYQVGATDFVGGASDGSYGVIGLDYSRNGVTARKAWFFFGDEVLALGAGITCQSTKPVYTSVNQCLLKGPVTVSTNGSRTAPALGTHALSNVSWVYHDSVGYFPLDTAKTMTLSNDIQSGAWTRINASGSSTAVSDTVFSLWIDHRAGPSSATYAYGVVPGMTADQVDAYVKSSHRSRLAANAASVQAACSDSLGVSGMVFYAPGAVTVADSLRVSVDRACCVLTRRDVDSLVVAVANPANAPCTVAVALSARLLGSGAAWNGQSSTVSFILPAGLDAGRSVVRRFALANTGLRPASRESLRAIPRVRMARRSLSVDFGPSLGGEAGIVEVFDAQGILVARSRSDKSGVVCVNLRGHAPGRLLLRTNSGIRRSTFSVLVF